MATIDASPQTRRRLSSAEPVRRMKGDPLLTRKLKELGQTDNVTNWHYLSRAYLVIAVAAVAAVAAYHYAMASDLGLLLFVPILAAAIAVIGASQHQLAGATHEATHHTLFRNRRLNELASDWLCMFPLFSTTYTFRLYHLMHHQYVNDPDRDPDFVVLSKSGHWLGFPTTARKFLGLLLKQATVLPLLKYIFVRAQHNSIGVGVKSSYHREEKASKLPERIGMAWIAGLVAMQVWLSFQENMLAALLMPIGYWLGLGAIYLALPERHFAVARVRPVTPRRYLAMSRTFYMMALFTGLTCLEIVSDQSVWWWYVALWIVPLLTTFPFFMILRQVVQHANGDRGWLTNTRNFLVNPLVRYAVFPFGMDYHLAHHMYATTPHYRLRELHQFLLQYPEYEEEGLVVENYLVPSQAEPRRPTVVEVLGSDYSRQSKEVFIDDTVLDNWEVDEKEQILREGRS